MTGKLVSFALFAALAGAGPALADLRGPAEAPPASFKGQQYVDSKGCVFVRAGQGKNTNWVPRIHRGKQMCNASPSSARAAVEENSSAAVAPPAAAAPVPEHRQPAQTAPARAVAPPPAAKAPPVAAAPEGYKSAWTDDRLNPDRAGGISNQNVQLRVRLGDGSTAERDAVVVRQEADGRVRVRLRGSGQELVVPQAALVGGGAAQTGAGPVSVATAGARVQVGSFGQPENAERAAARLASLGLPVMRNMHRGLEVISAGPFTSREDAHVALSMARRAGFSEAVVVP